MLLIYMKNSMRHIRNILYPFIATLFIVACAGQMDDTALPVLSVEDSEIDLANGESAVFAVTYNGADVTSQSRIFTQDGAMKLEGNVFEPDEAGEYAFVAEYNGTVSSPVVITVEDTTPPSVDSKFERHIFVAEFTGAWCVNCPDGYTNMHLILSLPSLRTLKDKIHIAAFHSDKEGTDTLAIPATQDVFRLFKGLAYPSYTIDLRDSGLLTQDGKGAFQPGLMTSVNDYPAHCGVSVSSVLNAEGTAAEVEVKVTSEVDSEYRVLVLVIQDRIEGFQKTNTYLDGQPGYVHNHVVRKVVTTYGTTFTGEKITEDGRIPAGVEASGTWTVQVDPRWKLEDTKVYALALDSRGYVNNMNLCAMEGGNSGYDEK